MSLAGNYVALVTPFRDGSVDQEAFEAHVARCVDGGVDGLVPCGTTGESPTLSHEEHDRVIEWTVAQAGGKARVMAGTGSNSTSEAVRLSKAAAKAGAHSVLTVVPYYNRPGQEGLYRHFMTVGDATDLPVVLYDIPGRTGSQLGFDTLCRLSEHPNIQGIKEAVGNVDRVTTICGTTNLSVLSGDDALTVPMMALGAQGVVSVLSNLLPNPVTQLTRSAADGDIVSARELHNRLAGITRALFLDSNPVPVKAALAECGWMTDEVRLPLTAMNDSLRAELRAALEPHRESLPLT